jgi:DNA-directed RNA polymerase I, II, and III subunit RPABC1
VGSRCRSHWSLDEQSTRLYQIRKMVIEMLRDRDYVVAEFELSFTKDQFQEKYGDEPKQEDLVIQKPSALEEKTK